MKPTRKTSVCDCSRPGIKRASGQFICDRCFDIERRAREFRRASRTVRATG
jgi:hypothetical protein